ncbi:glycosyltransferase family 4 protein [Candidatus Peregrinibacteria bacterium]|nr:glycosyltransferase family 4 protein [Candidatus Peregrinibacteria bacterium]
MPILSFTEGSIAHSRPRIVILSTFATPFRSGAEACSEEVARELQPRFDMIILTARLQRALPKRDRLPGGVLLVRIGLGCRFDSLLFPLLAPFAARRFRPRIVHAVLESYAGLALILCRWIVPGARRLLTLQSTNARFLLSPIHRSPRAITAISEALIRRAKQYGRNDVTLIPNGVSLALIQEACSRYPKRKGRILYVGRLEPMKGVDTLLRAFAMLMRLPQSHSGEETDLHIVGDGSQRCTLEFLACELGILNRVRFLGYIAIPAVYAEFAQAEIFCGLSRSEALGNVFLEAQAAGCAVLATRVGGIPEIIHDNETGILVAPDDPPVAAAHLRALLDDASLRTRLTEAGRTNAQRYDWKEIAERYGEVYEALLVSLK